MKRFATILMLVFLVTFASAQVNVTFRVNTAAMSEGVTDSTGVMHVRGDMNSWGDGNPMTCVGGDYWETTIQLSEGTYGYKFTQTDNITGGLNWESIDNRSVMVGTTDTVLVLAYFNNVAPYTATDDIDVFFRVSTAGIIGYAGETMNVRGSLAPLDWGTSVALTQEGDSDFWSGVVSFPAANAGTSVSYKFLQGEGWESIAGDRTFNLNADTTLAFKYFSDTPPVSSIDSFDVRIVMNTSTMANITDSTARFWVTGSYDGWVHEDDSLTQEGDYCYKDFTFVGPSDGIDLEFTFYYRNLATYDTQNWQGGSNLTPHVTSDTTLVYYWQNGDTPPYTPSDSVDVWFRVNMDGVAAFDGTDPVGVRGSIPLDPSWATAFELTQEGESGYYSGHMKFHTDDIGDTIQYKFVYGPTSGWDNVQWESPKNDTWLDSGNRYFFVSKDTTLAFKYFSDEPPSDVDPATHYVVFQVDMSAYIELGYFSEARKDSMQVRGGFNGWNDGDPLNSKMTKTPGTSIYTLAAEVTDFPESKIDFKYYMKLSQESLTYLAANGIDDVHPDWGYEVPPTRGGGNRNFVFSDGTDPQALDLHYYQGLPAAGIIAEGTTVPVTFSVDMSGVADFNAATDSVMFHMKDEWQTNAFGLRDSVVELTDSNADGIYEVTIDWVGPTAYTMIYTYSYAGPEGGLEEGGGFDFGRFRCRYIQPDALYPIAWPATYAVSDVFTADPPLEVEEPPFNVGIEEKAEVASRFELKQNYPNPFNPVTNIDFTIANKDHVSLTVYNMLGQKINEMNYGVLNAGQYSYTWNATDMTGNKVASGVYFYQLKSGNKVSVKKMLLMK